MNHESVSRCAKIRSSTDSTPSMMWLTGRKDKLESEALGLVLQKSGSVCR